MNVYKRIEGEWESAMSVAQLHAVKNALKCPESAYRFAKDTLKSSWPGGEKLILLDPFYAYLYAVNVLNKRWPEAEAVILDDTPRRMVEYARYVIKGRWPEAEAKIARDAGAAYEYARLVIQDRWEPGEPAIARFAGLSVDYAVYVLKSRFLAGEPNIVDPVNSWEQDRWHYEYYKQRYLLSFKDARDDWATKGWLDWLDT